MLMKRWQAEFDPDDTKDYVRDWTTEMAAINDTVATADFSILTTNCGLSVVSTVVDGTGKIATAWITASDKTVLRTFSGRIILLAHSITTTTGNRIYNETIGLKIMEK